MVCLNSFVVIYLNFHHACVLSYLPLLASVSCMLFDHSCEKLIHATCSCFSYMFVCCFVEKAMRIIEALEGRGCRVPLMKGEAELAEKLAAITRQVGISCFCFNTWYFLGLSK